MSHHGCPSCAREVSRLNPSFLQELAAETAVTCTEVIDSLRALYHATWHAEG